MPHLPWAQTGLTDVTGGILVLLLAAGLALLGLVVCAISLYFRKWILFIVGLALLSPALALAGYLFWEEIPRSYEWDFSADRSVARLEKEPVFGRYYYQGNLRTTIRLPGGRGWSGRAKLVTFDAQSGQVDAIYWDGEQMSAEAARTEARRILGELGLAETAPVVPSGSIVTGNLDVWYEAARSREWRNFNLETPAGSNPRVNLYLRRRSTDENEVPDWTLHVEVVWEE